MVLIPIDMYIEPRFSAETTALPVLVQTFSIDATLLFGFEAELIPSEVGSDDANEIALLTVQRSSEGVFLLPRDGICPVTLRRTNRPQKGFSRHGILSFPRESAFTLQTLVGEDMAEKKPLPFRASTDSILKGLKFGLRSLDPNDQLATITGSCVVSGITISGAHKSSTPETLRINYDDGTFEDVEFPAGHVIIFDLTIDNTVTQDQLCDLKFDYISNNGEKLKVAVKLRTEPVLLND
jgi:hypothetical protein